MYRIWLILLLVLLVLLVLLSHFAVAKSSGWQQAPHIKAELISEYSTVTPGTSVRLLLHFIPDEHWHTYWQNPGDSGLATSIRWQLPDGITAGDIQWPVPRAFSIPPLVNYGFEGTTLLLTELTIAADYAADTLPILAKADWLVCEEICIPAEATFNLTLPVAEQAIVAADYQQLFLQAEQSLPEKAGFAGQFDSAAGYFSAVIDWPHTSVPTTFFVAAGELVEHAAAQDISLSAGQLLLRQPLNTYFTAAPEQIEMILVSPEHRYNVWLDKAASGLSVGVAEAQSSVPGQNLLLVLLMAAAGGLILNLMPCVFPVLSLKALSIAANSQHRAQQRKDAWLYSLGVVLSFVTLAVVLILLRAAGNAIGWGFQLQSPWLIGLLVYLLFALGLSLSGVVQFGLGLMNTGNSLTQAEGGKGSFFTGVLAVVVASPCTAPFMGSALGYAVTQPPVIAILVFVALGLGMALPFILLAYIPALARLLPKPGVWMDQLKQWLAYPLYLSAVWLLWVYGRQVGLDAQALLLVGLVCIAAACWLWGRKQIGQGGVKTTVLTVALLLIAIWLVLTIRPAQQQTTAAEGQHWQAWSAVELQQLREQGKPVLVNMTADWCITCLVNERVALNTESSKAALKLYDVTYLKGDWTRQDAEITAYLRQYQRDGVPLYVLYWPGKPAQVLPQILTPDTLRQTLEKISSNEF